MGTRSVLQGWELEILARGIRNRLGLDKAKDSGENKEQPGFIEMWRELRMGTMGKKAKHLGRNGRSQNANEAKSPKKS